MYLKSSSKIIRFFVSNLYFWFYKRVAVVVGKGEEYFEQLAGWFWQHAEVQIAVNVLLFFRDVAASQPNEPGG